MGARDTSGVSRVMDRRHFLRHLAAATGTGAALALLAACGSTPDAPANTPAGAATGAGAAPTPALAPTGGGTAPPPAPGSGGTLTWGQWDKTDSIDPAAPTGSAALDVLTNVLDSLVMIDADEKVLPALAEKWSVEDSGKTYTFTLRDGVKFHDGTLLEAVAVKRTFERILDPATKAAGVVSLLGPIDRITAPDARTVTLAYKSPYPSLFLQLWRPYFGILSPRYLDTLKPGDPVAAPVGTGPFRFVGRTADGVIALEANKDYAWGAETLTNRNAPYLSGIKFRAIPEGATRVATLESGENLLIDEIPEVDYGRLKGDTRFRFIETPVRAHALGFMLNVQLAPTNDRAVREAINWAVDRQTIVQKLFFGVDHVSVGPLAEGVFARLADLEKMYLYDPKKAGQLLDDAGWKPDSDGIRAKGDAKLSLVLATFRDPWTAIAEAVQGQLRAVGIDLQVQKMERGAYLDFVRAYKHHLCATSSTSIDPDGILGLNYDSMNLKRTNFSNLNDPQLDTLLRAAAAKEIGSADRRKGYEDAQRRIMELVPFVGVMTQVRVEAMAAKVGGFRLGPDGSTALPLADTQLGR